MANNADLGTQLSMVGIGGLPTSYGVGTLFHASAATGLAVYLTIAFDATSNLTSVNVKLQGKYVGLGATTAFTDLQTTRQDTGATTNEQIIAVSAGNTITVCLETASNRFALGGLQLIAKGVGGAIKAGDSAIGSVVAW